MGGIPSRDAPTTFFSLRYGTHEVGLIPLVRRYFHKENVELRKQFVRMRNDPSVRYNFMRDPGYTMSELPPPTYTEEKLDIFLGVVEELLYDSMEEMLADEDTPLRPVPCAVCFIYVNGREGADCFSFYGRRINIIGQFGCHMYDDKPDDEPGLHLQKAILKAAGDRTLERVVTIAAKVISEQFFRAVAMVRPGEDAMEMFRRRISQSPLITVTPWNSYPALKFLYDTVVLAWSVGNVQSLESSPKFYRIEVEKSGESALVMEMDSSLLFKSINWMCSTLISSTLRGSWEQFMLNDALLQEKEKKVSIWLEKSPHVRNFLGEELTAHVQKHLVTLLGEVVRARETLSDDLTLWSAEQECGHDGKIYRIFNSPLCGPFLTTVKSKKGKKGDIFNDLELNKSNSFSSNLNCVNFNIMSASNGVNSNNFDNNGSNNDISCRNQNGVNGDLLELFVNSSNADEKEFYSGGKKQRRKNVNEHSGISRSPPKYQEAVKSVMSTPYIPSKTSSVCSLALPSCNLQPNATGSVPMQLPSVMMLPLSSSMAQKTLNVPSAPPQFMPTFMPVYSDSSPTATFPIQQVVMPSYVMVNPSSHSSQPQLQPQNFMPVSPNNIAAGVNSATTTDDGVTTTQTQQCVDQFSHAGNKTAVNVSSMFTPPVSNYVLLPDGRIGLLNTALGSSMNYWNN